MTVLLTDGIDRLAALPVWHQIRVDLESEIRSGLVGPGQKLPSEHELAARYGVNRHTVRAALLRLTEDGLVAARQGVGVFVTERPLEYAITRDSKWSEIERSMDVAPDTRLLKTSVRPASAPIAGFLGIEVGAETLMLESLRSASPKVATYGYHLFELSRFAGIEQDLQTLKSFTLVLAKFGIDQFYRQSTWLDCRMPRLVEAEALGLRIDQPVMLMTYVDADANGRPILYGSAVLSPGAVRLRVDTP